MAPPSATVPPGAAQPPGGQANTGKDGKEDLITDGDKYTNPMGSPLDDAMKRWYAAGKTPFTGIRRVGDVEVTQAHYSWMVELLPFLGHDQLYNKFDFSKPSLDRVNLQLAGAHIPQFQNPADPRKRWKGYPFADFALTHFVGMSGIEDTRNLVAAKLPRSDPRAGVFGYDEIAKPADIKDGTGQTIMVIGSGELAAPWIMGGGATIRGARQPYFDKLSGFGSRGRKSNGAVALMADGSVRQISAAVDPQVFRALCTIHGNDTVDQERAAPITTLDKEN